MRMRPLYDETVAKGEDLWWLNVAVNERFGRWNPDISIVPSTRAHGTRALCGTDIDRAASDPVRR